MRRFDSFEWFLILLFIVTCAVGVVIAVDRDKDRMAVHSELPERGERLRY